MGTARLKQYFYIWACWSCYSDKSALHGYRTMQSNANFYLEEVQNLDTLEIEIQQSSRLWNDATVWSLYKNAKEEFYVSQQR